MAEHHGALRGADKWITAKPQLVDAAAENRGLFRVWRPNAASLAALPYTDAAVAARKSFDLLAAAARCGPEGMPRIMITLFPYEFVDRGNEILVRAELYDTERVIHMDRTAPPPGEPHSVLGYSVGEWRDGVLVIKTSLVNWPYFDQIGTPLSDGRADRGALQGERRSDRLDVEITVTDPAHSRSPRSSGTRGSLTATRFGATTARRSRPGAREAPRRNPAALPIFVTA